MKTQNFDAVCALRDSKIILKYRTNSVVLLWKTPCILLKLFQVYSCRTVTNIWFYDFKPVLFIKFRGKTTMTKTTTCLFDTIWTTERCFSCRTNFEGKKKKRI